MNAEVSKFQALADANNIPVELLERSATEITGLTPRCPKGLKELGLEQIGDIVVLSYQQLFPAPNIGHKNGKIIRDHIEQLGLWMEMDMFGTKPFSARKPLATAQASNNGPDSIAAAYDPLLESDFRMIQSLKNQLEVIQNRMTENEFVRDRLQEKEKTILDGFAAAGVEVSAEMRRTVVATLLKQAPALKA